MQNGSILYMSYTKSQKMSTRAILLRDQSLLRASMFARKLNVSEG